MGRPAVPGEPLATGREAPSVLPGPCGPWASVALVKLPPSHVACGPGLPYCPRLTGQSGSAGSPGRGRRRDGLGLAFLSPSPVLEGSSAQGQQGPGVAPGPLWPGLRPAPRPALAALVLARSWFPGAAWSDRGAWAPPLPRAAAFLLSLCRAPCSWPLPLPAVAAGVGPGCPPPPPPRHLKASGPGLAPGVVLDAGRLGRGAESRLSTTACSVAVSGGGVTATGPGAGCGGQARPRAAGLRAAWPPFTPFCPPLSCGSSPLRMGGAGAQG